MSKRRYRVTYSIYIYLYKCFTLEPSNNYQFPAKMLLLRNNHSGKVEALYLIFQFLITQSEDYELINVFFLFICRQSGFLRLQKLQLRQGVLGMFEKCKFPTDLFTWTAQLQRQKMWIKVNNII